MSQIGDGIDITETMRAKMQLLLEDIKDIRDTGKTVKTNPDLEEYFLGMYDSLPGLYESYCNLYNDLAELKEDDGTKALREADINQRKTVRRYFHESNGYIITVRNKNSVPGGNTGNNTTINMGTSKARAKLPTIELPKFKGDRKCWPRYRDLFESLVIGDPDLADADKFHYLLSSVEEPASAIINNLPVTGDNFNVAWNALKKQYNNQRLLAASYLDKILDVRQLDRRPTAEVLATRLSELSEAVGAFKLLNVPNPQEFIFFHLASRTLDSATRVSFENANCEPFPSFESLIEFLRKRATASELALPSTSSSRNHSKNSSDRRQVLISNHKPNNSSSSLNSSPYKGFKANSPKSSCFVCQQNHTLVNCPTFGNSSPEERIRLLRDWKGCRNCLFMHSTKLCPSKWSCRYCSQRHHSMLHIYADKSTRTNYKPSPGSRERTSNSPAIHSSAINNQSSSSQQSKGPTVLNATVTELASSIIATGYCRIGNHKNNLQMVRMALDSGSEATVMTRDCATRLGLYVQPTATKIWGIGGNQVEGSTGITQCIILPLHNNTRQLTANVLVVEKATPGPLPSFNSSCDLWESYREYELADPEFWIPKPVDILIGCDLYFETLTGEIITISPNLPGLIGTMFGFVVTGRMQDLNEAKFSYSLVTGTTRTNSVCDNLHLELQRFWELEEPPVARKSNPLEEQCEAHFKTTHYRLPSGHYGVRLPFKEEEPMLFNSRNIGLKRLYHMEGKLERNPILKAKYHEFMQEYLDLDHMSLASQPGKVLIPHHCVTKGEGDDMKIRVVFDAAANYGNGSLNDNLLIGPKLQTDIAVILLNFRIHAFVFTADAVKMFRQIYVHPDDRTYQHILFRFDPSDIVHEYELNTVTYGTSPAPYLAHRVMKQLREDEGTNFPLAAAALRDDMYVDDLATGASTLIQALELQKQIIALMGKGGFELGKWATNHPALTSACSSETSVSTIQSPISLETEADSNIIKILGMQWDPTSDEFMYKIVPPVITNTKRGVLSSVAKIYDPLGYLGPTVILAKQIIQIAWKQELDWDQPFPKDLQDQWKMFVDQLPKLTAIRIPRWILSEDSYNLRLLIFADASERAYCASAYIHHSSKFEIKTNLLIAKTKLAPVKATTIPRLELCAALLAARLRQSLVPFCTRIGRPIKIYCFTDSTVVLSWLATPTFKLKTFVANRVEMILNLTKEDTWHHVASADNPSDLGSRGIRSEELLNNNLWFHGPPWAQNEPGTWPLASWSPDQKITSSVDDVPELKPTPTIVLVSTPIVPMVITLIENISSFISVIRTMAYILRYLDNIRPDVSTKSKGPLSLSEIRRAHLMIIKHYQAYYIFNKNSPNDVSSNATIPNNLQGLSPFFDKDGVLLVGGRLQNSDLPYAMKHPILILPKTHLARLLIGHYHRSYLHAGPSMVTALLRTKYWIVGGSNAVRFQLRNCVKCRKLNASPVQPIMGNLPASRFQEVRAFLHVGIDFAGPFIVRESQRRKAPKYKAYLCIFVCLSTKAVHLEAVTSLTTEAFFGTLTRFIGRRGCPEKVCSDNGTNFVGATKYLKDLYAWYLSEETQKELQLYTTMKNIDWIFTPPSAPSFGGIWEAAVKGAKNLLRTVYGEAVFTFEELATLFIRIEAILNSRPLYPLSSDPNDFTYLSPGHFLIGQPLLAEPEKSLTRLPENRLSRWQLVYQKTQHFWKRWRQEYLSTLQQRNKWTSRVPNIQLGDLVVIKDDNAPRLQWPVGRICNTYPGSDGVVRVALVKTAKTTLKRPVNKLILLLPADSSTDTGKETAD